MLTAILILVSFMTAMTVLSIIVTVFVVVRDSRAAKQQRVELETQFEEMLKNNETALQEEKTKLRAEFEAERETIDDLPEVP